ncbi:MAG: 30S ribosomal protein S12 methylthiotransferase RimO [Clostridia bacterium]|nr:30S ribosomal protein S12 methylthiotransferase RimO [Clostridia bacterium]
MSKKKTVALISLGCPKNQVDAELMLAKLQNDFTPVGSADGADLAIVNTCGFIDDAKREAIEAILTCGELKKAGRLGKLLVTGCLAERYRNEVLEELPEIDGIIGLGRNGDIADVCRSLFAGRHVCDFPSKYDLPLSGDRVLSTPPHFAYLKIAEGCSNNCTYCAIPSIRGKMRSRPIEDLTAEAEALAAQGVKELVVIAQDVTKYGVDLYHKLMLPALLDALCKVDGIEWIRLLYCYPDCLTDELIDTIARQEKICNYIDLPLQHADADILKRMHRTGDEQSLLALIRKLRARIPGVVIRTTFITGFPGETEAQFETLSRFVNEARFDRLGCFAYSPEEGTPAAAMDGQLPDEIKRRRSDVIMQQQYEIFQQKQQSRVGNVFRVLVDGFDEDDLLYLGRTYMDCAEIDSQVILSTEEELLPGQFVNVKITGVCDYDLVGDVLPNGE